MPTAIFFYQPTTGFIRRRSLSLGGMGAALMGYNGHDVGINLWPHEIRIEFNKNYFMRLEAWICTPFEKQAPGYYKL